MRRNATTPGSCAKVFDTLIIRTTYSFTLHMSQNSFGEVKMSRQIAKRGVIAGRWHSPQWPQDSRLVWPCIHHVYSNTAEQSRRSFFDIWKQTVLPEVHLNTLQRCSETLCSYRSASRPRRPPCDKVPMEYVADNHLNKIQILRIYILEPFVDSFFYSFYFSIPFALWFTSKFDTRKRKTKITPSIPNSFPIKGYCDLSSRHEDIHSHRRSLLSLGGIGNSKSCNTAKQAKSPWRRRYAGRRESPSSSLWNSNRLKFFSVWRRIRLLLLFYSCLLQATGVRAWQYLLSTSQVLCDRLQYPANPMCES